MALHFGVLSVCEKAVHTQRVCWRRVGLDNSRLLEGDQPAVLVRSEGETLSFGSIELWLAPIFTVIAGAALVGSLVLLVRGRQSLGA